MLMIEKIDLIIDLLQKDMWNEIIYISLGAFLGALASYFFERFILEHSRVKNKKKTIFNFLMEELDDFEIILKLYNGSEKLDAQIQTPSWDAIVNSGNLMDIIGDKHFFPGKTYKDLIDFYTEIKKNNEIILLGKNGQELIKVCELRTKLNVLLANMKKKKKRE